MVYNVRGANGALRTATSWQSYGRNCANVSNTPFSKFKIFTHEGGIRTPLIVYYPKLIKKKRIEMNVSGHVIDIMPTILKLSSIKHLKTYKGKLINPMAGESLVPVLKREESKERLLFWNHAGNRGCAPGGLEACFHI